MVNQRSVTVGAFRASYKERQYVNKVLDSGRLSYGPFSKDFEARWAREHDCNHAVFCNSGTSALHIAVAALKDQQGWQDGDEVLVPSVTFVATSNVVIHNNLKPVFVDVDPLTYNIDPNLIRKKITARTRAIMPVHLTGLPAEMREISIIAKRYNLSVIEDSCETTFASCHGRKVGSWGDIGCFSTYMAHYIVTGVGGLATTNDPELAVKLRSLMNHGRDGIYTSIDDDDGLSGDKLKEVISRRFNFTSVGHSFRCTEMEAALGLAQLEEKNSIVHGRKSVAESYTRQLSKYQDVLQLPTEPRGLEHVYMIYPIVLKKLNANKTDLVNHLESRGIETRDLLPLLSQPVYKRMFGDIIGDYPVAEHLNSAGFYIGCHQYLDGDDIAHVGDAFREFFAEKGSRS